MADNMINWKDGPLVVRREGYIGGKPALRDDPRVPPEVIYENMDDGMTAEEVIDSYSLRAADRLVRPAPRCLPYAAGQPGGV